MAGFSTSASQGSSQGSSTSVSQAAPVAVQTPQSQYDLALAQEIAALGQNQYNWAKNQYSYLKGIASTAIPNYLTGSNFAENMAQNMYQQYAQMYMPAEQQFATTANNFASAPRIAAQMGAAEATAGGAAAQSWQSTQDWLRSMGVDPSSGEYAGLKAAANTAAGASAAGAGNQAREATINEGLQLQGENIGYGLQTPGMANAAINTAYGGLSGAVNTGESTVNTGTNAFGSANNFYGNAMKLQQPPVGQQSSSSSSSQNTSQQQSSSNSMQSNPPPQQPSSGGSGGGGSGYNPGYGGGGGGSSGSSGGGGGGGGNYGLPSYGSPSQPNPAGGGYNNIPFTTTDSGGYNPASGYTSGSGADAYSGSSGGGGGSYGGYSRGGGIPEPHGHQGRPHPPHPYHVNGLPDAATGGHIPYELSPSHGHTTDDVVANLNAGEFVLPRRTVHHLGNKFLYDLIAKSDKEMGLHPQSVGAQPLKKGSGAAKAREAAGVNLGGAI